MRIVTKINYDTAEKLLEKRFNLFNKEIIIPWEEFKKIPNDIIFSLKLQGCYFTYNEVINDSN